MLKCIKILLPYMAFSMKYIKKYLLLKYFYSFYCVCFALRLFRYLKTCKIIKRYLQGRDLAIYHYSIITCETKWTFAPVAYLVTCYYSIIHLRNQVHYCSSCIHLQNQVDFCPSCISSNMLLQYYSFAKPSVLFPQLHIW